MKKKKKNEGDDFGRAILKFRQKSFNCTHSIRPIRRRRLGRHLMSSCHRPLSLQFSTASQRSPAFQRNHIEKSGTFSSATLVSGPKVPPPHESRDDVLLCGRSSISLRDQVTTSRWGGGASPVESLSPLYAVQSPAA
jgi:hypothetical protein